MKSLAGLKAQGFEAVVYLAPPTVSDAIPGEAKIVGGQGLVFVNIPIVFDNPTEGDFETFVAVMKALSGRKVLVHCQINLRASSMTFLYRAIVAQKARRGMEGRGRSGLRAAVKTPHRGTTEETRGGFRDIPESHERQAPPRPRHRPARVGPPRRRRDPRDHGIVETMHHNISRVPLPLGKSTQKPTKGITGLVYRSIRGVTKLVGGGVDFALANLASLVGEEPSSPAREAVLAALNGVLGDHLAASGNPLAIPMRFRRGGQALVLRRPSLAKAIPQPTGRILILLHGCAAATCSGSAMAHDHGAAIASDADFEPYTPVYLHYNSGLHVSTNGREFARLVESLVRAWPVPVEEIAILAHSMGGLVARSALHYAAESKRAWLGKVTRIVFLGTPHDGAPLERGGNWVNVVLDKSPYTTAFSRLGKLRSAGITDLRHGNLLDDDWMGKDRFAASSRVTSKRRLVPLPEGRAVCGRRLARPQSSGLRERFLGDGLVQVPSALGHGRTPRARSMPPSGSGSHGMNHPTCWTASGLRPHPALAPDPPRRTVPGTVPFCCGG
jgi:pimeloyl-ACP methyl ester carboxylesterase/protein tyrosine phosphatase (PTP) superfamily phosphohydrolase (DUF442 family)